MISLSDRLRISRMNVLRRQKSLVHVPPPTPLAGLFRWVPEGVRVPGAPEASLLIFHRFPRDRTGALSVINIGSR